MPAKKTAAVRGDFGNLCVIGCIPSLAVLKGGGYEAVDRMAYYGTPGPFDDSIEETIFAGIHSVMKRVGK
jgi:hypothetical protein